MRFRSPLGPTPDDLAFVFRRRHLSWDFLPFGAFVPWESTYPQSFHPPGYGPCSGFFRPHHGLLLPRPCRFISPCKRPSASPSRDFPLEQGQALIASRLTVVPLPRRSTRPRCLAAEPPRQRKTRNLRDRLRGFTPLENPHCQPQILSAMNSRFPPGISPLQGLPAMRCGRSSRSLLPCASSNANRSVARSPLFAGTSEFLRLVVLAPLSSR